MFSLHATYYRLLLILLFSMLLAGVCHAQEIPKQDTTKVVAPIDTTLDFNERVLKSLRQLSERKTILGKVVKSVVVFDRVDEEVKGLDAELIQREYERHNYKIVRSIEIRTLDAFGYSINDTSRVPRTFLERAGNTLHAKTKRSVIRNKLLFRTNRPLEPLALVESERLLRQTSYILDARIFVDERTTTEDSVDIFILTKDVFSLGGSGSYTPSSGSGRISLGELNFGGLGHQVRGSYRFGLNRPRSWETYGYYAIENISNSYISARANYFDQNFYKEKSFYLQRDFFATNTKYAGAAGLSQIQERILLPNQPNDTVLTYGNLRYTRQDAWLGRSLKFKSYNLGYEPRGRVILGLRFINTDYTVTPTDNFQNNLLMLGSVGYSVRRYYKDRYLFGFGRTEDVPAGTFVSFTGGYEKGDVVDRKYIGGEVSFARHTPTFGYLYNRVAYGSFLRDDVWEQGVLTVESLYFSKLFERGNWKLRHFLQGRGTFGINRNPEELLSINNELGLRGFRSDFARGTRRIVFNYEANLYTPLSLLGFRLATVLFADVAWLSTGNQSSPFKETPFRAYGIGFRFRNEYLYFSTIQILFSYYPKVPANGNINDFRFYESSRPYYDFPDFRFTRPGVAEFR
ncbi:hypothetical protein [Pontibacter ruber]|uniref:POTRA domain-containing protein n=1 Tax=Pontibacter ruber TaxID=1343895 RepID=A0ABW5D3Z8_9BACT|nr:hypothetical protein [Pontibacter ruber]